MIGRGIRWLTVAFVLLGTAAAQEVELRFQCPELGTADGPLEAPGAWLPVRSVQFGVAAPADGAGVSAGDLVVQKEFDFATSPRIARTAQAGTTLKSLRIAFVRTVQDRPVEIGRFDLQGVRILQVQLHAGAMMGDTIGETLVLRCSKIGFRSVTLDSKGSPLLEREGSFELGETR